MYGGILFSFADLFSIISSGGFPSFEEDSTGIARLIQGATFSFGLVIVYFVGTEMWEKPFGF